MKSFFSALSCIGMILISASCNLSHTDKDETTPVMGHWRLDSISAPEGQGNMGLLLLAMASEDSAGTNVTDFYFTKDSVYYDFNDGDTTRARYQLDESKHILKFTEDNETQNFEYRFSQDSTLILKGEDSVVLFFRKK